MWLWGIWYSDSEQPHWQSIVVHVHVYTCTCSSCCVVCKQLWWYISFIYIASSLLWNMYHHIIICLYTCVHTCTSWNTHMKYCSSIATKCYKPLANIITMVLIFVNIQCYCYSKWLYYASASWHTGHMSSVIAAVWVCLGALCYSEVSVKWSTKKCAPPLEYVENVFLVVLSPIVFTALIT